MRADPAALHALLLGPDDVEEAPLKPTEVFGRSAPLRAEIGFGGGESLRWMAEQLPDHNFLGFELPPDCIVRAAHSIHKAGCENVRLVQGDARFLLDLLVPPGALERLLMQFPMPWPKKKHAKHRVSSPAFAGSLARALQPGGRFELVTDQEWYAEEAHAVFEAHAAFGPAELIRDPDRAFRTRYESKWLKEGRTIHRMRAERLSNVTVPEALLSAVPMENVHLVTLPTAAEAQALVGSLPSDGDLQAEVKRVWAGENGWLVQVLAADSGFAQLFHLRIRSREDGAPLLQVGHCPRPYWTPAVRHALRQVGAALTATP